MPLCLLSNAPFSSCQYVPHSSPTPPSVPGLPQGRKFSSNFSKVFRPGLSEGGVNEVRRTVHSSRNDSMFTNLLSLGKKIFRDFQIQRLNRWSKKGWGWGEKPGLKDEVKGLESQVHNTSMCACA